MNRARVNAASLALSALLILSSCGQSSESEQQIKLEWYCSYFGKSLHPDQQLVLFAPDKEVESMVAGVMKHTGLKPNFTLFAYPGSSNALAGMDKQNRLIFYDPIFMRDVVFKTRSDWTEVSIIAHEIGHHLLGHTLDNVGSRPDRELEADHYSGFTLQKMGATLDQATAAMRLLGSDQPSQTHPVRSQRLREIQAGWHEAAQLERRPAYTAKCLFNGNPNPYYVASNDHIIGVNQFGQAVIVGRKIPPTYPGFAWMFQISTTGAYGVDSNGIIWDVYPNGAPFRVGYVTTP